MTLTYYACILFGAIIGFMFGAFFSVRITNQVVVGREELENMLELLDKTEADAISLDMDNDNEENTK